MKKMNLNINRSHSIFDHKVSVCVCGRWRLCYVYVHPSLTGERTQDEDLFDLVTLINSLSSSSPFVVVD